MSEKESEGVQAKEKWEKESMKIREGDREY